MAQSFGDFWKDVDDPNAHMLDANGVYDFTKKEERHYSCSHDYLAGSLGQEEYQETIKKRKEKGKIDLPVILPPADAKMREIIEKLPAALAKTSDPDLTELTFFTKQSTTFGFLREKDGTTDGKGPAGLLDGEDSVVAKLWNGKRKGYDCNEIFDSICKAGAPEEEKNFVKNRLYYLFVKHCHDRAVDPAPLVAKQELVEKDRQAKTFGIGYGSGSTAGTAGGSTAAGSNTGGGSSGSTGAGGAASGSAGGSSSSTGAGAPAGEGGAPGGSAGSSYASQQFPNGTKVEILGIKAKPEYNGQEATIQSYDEKKGRYNVMITKWQISAALKADNLMLAKMGAGKKGADGEEDSASSDEEGQKVKWKHPIPQYCMVTLRGLQSEAGKKMNGMRGQVVSFEDKAGRYNVKMEDTQLIKQLKGENLKCDLPEGWKEYWDEHLGKHYYKNEKANKTSWKHPTMKVRIGHLKQPKWGVTGVVNQDAEKAVFEKKYKTDGMAEGEGNFNLKDLIKQVQRKEDRKRRRAQGEVVESSEDEDPDSKPPPVKRTKRDQKRMLKADYLAENVAELKKEHGNSYDYYDKKECLAWLEKHIKDLQKVIDDHKSAKRDQNITDGKFEGSQDDEDEEDAGVYRSGIPDNDWSESIQCLAHCMQLMGNEFAKNKFTIQNMNLTCLELLEGRIDTAEVLRDKMESVSSLMKISG